MSLLLWAFIIGGALAIAAIFIDRLNRMHRRARFVDTPTWQREHSQEEHERTKFAQRRTPGGL